MININPSSLCALLAALWISAPAGAEPVFPPQHLHAEAEFSPGNTSSEPTGDAWYHAADSDVREHRIATEATEVSPYPSLYYFINIRNYANDESERLEAIRAAGKVTTVDVVSTPADSDDPS